MTRSVRVRPEAERDVETAFAWYEEQRPGLDREFLHELDVVYKRIANFPFLYAELYRGLRPGANGRATRLRVLLCYALALTCTSLAPRAYDPRTQN